MIELTVTYTHPDGTVETQLRAGGFENVWDAHRHYAMWCQDRHRKGLPYGGAAIQKADEVRNFVYTQQMCNDPEVTP
jgi:hypothetical protein